MQVPLFRARLSYRVEIRSLARQAGEIHVVAEFAAEHRMIEGVIVVDHWMNDRYLALRVGLGKAE